MSLRLDDLNPQQREAVLHGEGPLLILAGAGSGKTNTMARRIAHLIAARGVPPGRVLGLSFTNKAATELKERVARVAQTSGASARGLVISTFHSLGARILRVESAKAGLPAGFTIMDRRDQEGVLKEILRSTRIDDRRFDLGAVLFQFGQAKNRFLDGSEAGDFFDSALPGDYAEIARAAFPRYQARLRALGAVDFDDLIFRVVRLLEEDEETGAKYASAFLHILVDEYQDTNPAQFRLLRAFTRAHRNICVVGDDDQSIYGWRGAESRHILSFSDQFPGARVITLDQNYRSTRTILEAANQVIRANPKRHPKSLWSERGEGAPIRALELADDREEADAVATEILAMAQRYVEGTRVASRPWRDFAVLYRANFQSRVFEEALRRYRIPYRIVGGISFLERKEIRDALAYWRVIVNPMDEASLLRIINWPARGIGDATVEALRKGFAANASPAATDDPALSREGGFPDPALGAGAPSLFPLLAGAAGLAPKARSAVEGLQALLGELRAGLESSAPDPAALSRWAKASLERIGVRKQLLAESEDPVVADRKAENVDELCNSIGQWRFEAADPVAALTEFLTGLALREAEEEDTDEAARDEVALLTLHGAKGKEFPVVFLVGMEEGSLPHRRVLDEGGDLAEERRLCYVGITRAKDQLFLTRAKERVRYGKPVPRYPSRFLADIPKELLLDESAASAPESRDGHLAALRAIVGRGASPTGRRFQS